MFICVVTIHHTQWTNLQIEVEANLREAPVVGGVVGAGLLPVDAVHGDIEEHVELAQVGPVPGQPVLAGVALAVGRPVLLELETRTESSLRSGVFQYITRFLGQVGQSCRILDKGKQGSCRI